MAEHMRIELAAEPSPWPPAPGVGRPPGSSSTATGAAQCLSGDYRQLVVDLGMVQSVARTGVCCNNNVAEAF